MADEFGNRQSTVPQVQDLEEYVKTVYDRHGIRQGPQAKAYGPKKETPADVAEIIEEIYSPGGTNTKSSRGIQKQDVMTLNAKQQQVDDILRDKNIFEQIGNYLAIQVFKTKPEPMSIKQALRELSDTYGRVISKYEVNVTESQQDVDNNKDTIYANKEGMYAIKVKRKEKVKGLIELREDLKKIQEIMADNSMTDLDPELYMKYARAKEEIVDKMKTTVTEYDLLGKSAENKHYLMDITNAVLGMKQIDTSDLKITCQLLKNRKELIDMVLSSSVLDDQALDSRIGIVMAYIRGGKYMEKLITGRVEKLSKAHGLVDMANKNGLENIARSVKGFVDNARPSGKDEYTNWQTHMDEIIEYELHN